MSKTFHTKIGKKNQMSVSLDFFCFVAFPGVSGRFSAMGVQKHYLQLFTKQSCRMAFFEKNPNRLFLFKKNPCPWTFFGEGSPKTPWNKSQKNI
jgi:hypothetical protein